MERRNGERRKIQERRKRASDSGRARSDRRLQERRVQEHEQSSNSEQILTQTVPYREPQIINPPICLWVFTDRVEFFNQLNDCLSNLAHIHASQMNFTEISKLDDQSIGDCPDVMLIDARERSAAEISKRLDMIRKNSPRPTKIAVLYQELPPEIIDLIVVYQVTGLLPLDSRCELIVKMITVVNSGELWIPYPLLQQIFVYCSTQQPPPKSYPNLTKNENKIVSLVAKGLTNKQIAQQLGVSPETIKKHLRTIFTKLDVHTRGELISKCFLG